MQTALFQLDWKKYWSADLANEGVGAVYTKPHIVELILDLSGYTTDKPLLYRRLLEPSCGDGAFVTKAVERLVDSALGSHDASRFWRLKELGLALRATDIDRAAVEKAREAVVAALTSRGCPPKRATQLAGEWIVWSDVLLADVGYDFDYVVGNPPYVRIEELPRRVLAEYRSRYETLTNRADLYVAFFERGLALLREGGTLSYICANRFTKNQYGAALRRLISRSYSVNYYLNLEHTQPFEAEVSAYPAIFVLSRPRQGARSATFAATLDDLSERTLQRLKREATAASVETTVLSRFDSWYPGGAPWIATSHDASEFLAEAAAKLPVLEDSARGTRLGIGVATGADRIFILPELNREIEHSRQLRLILSKDVSSASVEWSGTYLLNPFADDDSGRLVDLAKYPGLERYFLQHESTLRNRHVAKARDVSWYRTIDRVWAWLSVREKLLIPDIQGGDVIGHDAGTGYPCHNLYWLISEGWPLSALQAILRSRLVRRQVEAYSVQMRGGALRYQTQTLRRVRVPPLSALGDGLISDLARAGACADADVLNQLAEKAFAAVGVRAAAGEAA
jgi:adenine-specific DNA-methyltransferase